MTSGDTSGVIKKLSAVAELLGRLTARHQALTDLAQEPPITNGGILTRLGDDVLLDLGSARQIFDRDVRSVIMNHTDSVELSTQQKKKLATALNLIAKHLGRIQNDATQVRDALDGRRDAIEGSYGDKPKGKALRGDDPDIGSKIADTIRESIEAGPVTPPRRTNSTEEPELSAEQQCRNAVTNLLSLAMDGAPICAKMAADLSPVSRHRR